MSEAAALLAYVRKAERALAGARLLLAAEDPIGACNRAYYSMFHAAQAGLLAARGDIPASAVKTHRGLIAAFGQVLVRGGHIAPEFGAAFNKVERLRLLADYTGDPVSREDAEWALRQAEAFIAVIKSSFSIG